jgi:hypothetical protein
LVLFFKIAIILNLSCMFALSTYGANEQQTYEQQTWEISKPKTIPTVPTTTSNDKAGASLHFQWESQKPAIALIKMFQGMNKQTWWVVFDEAANIQLPNLQEHPLRDIKNLEVIPAKEGSVIQISTEYLSIPSVNYESHQWNVSFGVSNSSNSKVAQVQLPQTLQDGLVVSLVGTGKEVRVMNPANGFVYVIFPSYEVGFKTDHLQTFPEFSLMETAQGVGLQLMRDDLVITSTPTQVSITHPSGLAISSPQERNREQQLATPAGYFTEASDLDWTWRLQKLNENLLDLSHDQHGPIELEMAWLSLGYGHTDKALGYLRHLSQERPSISDTKIFHMLMGMGNLLSYQLPEAEAHFWACRGEPEAEIWRALTNALKRPGMIASNAMKQKDYQGQLKVAYEVIKKYPRPLQLQLKTLILLAGIAGNDLEILKMILEKEGRPENIHAAEVHDLARAHLLMSQNKPDAALQIMGELMEKATSQMVKSIARYDYIAHRVATNLMNKEDAIAQLEAIRLQWHGNWLGNKVDQYLDSLRSQTATKATKVNSY